MEPLSESNATLKSLSGDLAQVVERSGPAVVAVNARRHLSSSGVCWRDGIVVTAAHTVRRTDNISVISPQGATLAATLAGADPSTDLAVLRVPAAEVSPPLFGDTDRLEIGHLVIAVGRGARRGLNATLGIVGVLSGAWRTWAGGLIDRFVGLNISLHPGAAGGPLIDTHGRVLGINTSALSRDTVLTIPVSTVDRVVDQLLEKGRMSRGYLGLGMYSIPLPGYLKDSHKLSADSGLIVVSVEQHGPGDRAGVLLGDVVVAVEGKAVGSVRDLRAFLDPSSVNKTISLSVIRAGEAVELKLTVGER